MFKSLSKSDLLKPIASLNDGGGSRTPLFLHKLRLCCILFEWNEEASQKDARAKEVKRQQLLELVEYIGNGKNKNIYTDAVLAEIIQMVSANLFRALPPKTEGGTGGGKQHNQKVIDVWIDGIVDTNIWLCVLFGFQAVEVSFSATMLWSLIYIHFHCF